MERNSSSRFRRLLVDAPEGCGQDWLSPDRLPILAVAAFEPASEYP